MFSDTADIVPFPALFRRELLASEQVETLQAGMLRLLAEVGIHLPSCQALEIFDRHGARVDWDQEIVRIPPDLVTRAMSIALRSIVLGGREERFDLFLDGSCSYLATDGTGVHVVDLETRATRPSRKEDVALMARVCDALRLVSFFWPLVSAQDFGLTAPLHQCHAGLTNTLKHVRGGMTVPPVLAPHVVEMATVVAGSAELLWRRPPICAMAPLAHDADGIEAALIYAEAGIPTSFMAMPTIGSTAPATPLGALVVGDAEVVSAVVLVQLACPGAPVFHSIIVSLMDPRTGGYIGKVPVPVTMMAVQLGHAWNVPSLGGGGVASDAPGIGGQSGMEAGLGAVMIPLCGGEICGFMGLVGGSMILYPEQALLDHEVCQNAYGQLHGFEFSQADMAPDVIAEAGPRSHFLRQRRTRQRIRDFRLSRLLRQKGSDGAWPDPREVARAKFKRISESHYPQPLPREVVDEMDCILAAAEREAERLG
jgi:trimethylamine--corrinoid protein Co-methyltransferase